VFQGTDPANQVSASGSVVAGFVERILNYYNFTITSAGTLGIPDKTPVTVALKGDFYVAYNQSATPTIGQKALLLPLTAVSCLPTLERLYPVTLKQALLCAKCVLLMAW
jgi:hypothetical protein